MFSFDLQVRRAQCDAQLHFRAAGSSLLVGRLSSVAQHEQAAAFLLWSQNDVHKSNFSQCSVVAQMGATAAVLVHWCGTGAVL